MFQKRIGGFFNCPAKGVKAMNTLCCRGEGDFFSKYVLSHFFPLEYGISIIRNGSNDVA
ncbi:hypothetical protein [Anaerotignum sp.]|uniref:hypothetical protein n=1 Tax=Anaerotignum sp. TaxID=2039241 RepID=UPI0033254D1D